MTETERDIALALPKRLRQRQLIPEETYLAAAASGCFDRRRFTPDAGAGRETVTEEVERNDRNPVAPGAAPAGNDRL